MWEIGRRLGHYGDHPHPQVVDRGTPSRVDKRVAPDREGATVKQCQGEGKLWSQYVITECEEGKGKPPQLFSKTGYPLGYPEPALLQKTEERDRDCFCARVLHHVTQLMRLLTPTRNAKYCDEYVCLSVWLSVCSLTTVKPHSLISPIFCKGLMAAIEQDKQNSRDSN